MLHTNWFIVPTKYSAARRIEDLAAVLVTLLLALSNVLGNTVPPKYSDRPAIIEVDRLPFVLRFCRGTAAYSARRTNFDVQNLGPPAARESRLAATTRRFTSVGAKTAEANAGRPNGLVWLRRVWGDWKSVLMIVKADTVVAWQRKGFRLFWTWKIHRGKPGRPCVPHEVRNLIRMMSRNNPRWGAPRIHGELLKLGIEITETTVAKYMVRLRKPPSQTWRTFLENHVKSIVSVDFFTVPTIRFQLLYVFLVLAHDRRRILHFGVTAHPTAEWTAQQLREAFPWDSAPRYLLRDRDQIFGKEFVDQVKAMGIKQVLSAPRSP